MATPERLTRSVSRSSSTSTIMSNIDVAMSESGSSVAEHPSPLPTPATSVTDGSAGDAASEKPETATISRDVSAQPEMSTARRSIRSRSSVESYNLAKLSGVKHGKRVAQVKESRSFSGDTLVNDLSLEAAETPQQRRRVLEGEVEKALQMDWQVGHLASEERPASAPAASIKKRKSVSLEKITKAAGKISSALGKRSRESLSLKSSTTRQSLPRQSTRKIDVVVKVQDVDDEEEQERSDRPTKKARLLDTIVEITSSLGRRAPVKKPTKPWLAQGLYCGQNEDAKATVSDSKKPETLATSVSAPGLSRRYLPLPMFSAATRESDFHITYDLFAPLKRKENPKEWKKLSRNSFTPSAKEVWRFKKMDRSICLCRPPASDSRDEGCDENCINRHMLYECDENNCALGAELCTNRAFADLAKRTKKGNEFDIGVEIIKTPECGYGLRTNRSFAPGQIIIEYCGEVISQEESDRRMNEVYKDNNAYYLMEFDQGMIIDATKGNIARFVNHSCQPNCKMEKRIVKGEPKMALFAGRNGVKTGEELSYDYNFDNFSALNVLDCRCGAELCRGKLERRDAKKEKETLAASLKRKLLEATTGAPEPAPEKVVLKKRKTGRWTKGWSYVDPEMEALRLKEDALENGRAIDGRALEVLKEQAMKEDEKADAFTNGSKSGRSSRAAGLAAKAKLVERANSVRSVLSRKKTNPDLVQEKKERRKSALGRAAGALKSAASVSPKVEDESLQAVTEKRFSFEASEPLLSVETDETSKQKQKTSKALRQSTLGFQRVSEEKPRLPALPAALHEDEDVLEMVLGYGGAGRGENACDPQNFEPNLALCLEISDLINSKKGNAPREAAVAIVNYINHRNQNVSLLALSLLDICVKNCGYPFHLQISTKEFLNELVRRFPERPPVRPTRTMNRILELIEEWRSTICQTSKHKEDLGFIRDMHRLLSYKGYVFPEVRREDAAVLNPSDNLRSAEEMEEEEKSAQSAKLQELIRRGTPRDLQEANKLMKVMAGYDQRNKTDYRAKAAEEVGRVQQKARILEEMLQGLKPGDSVNEGDVFEELANALASAHPKIQKMCEEESDDHEAVAKLLEINDSIHRTIERYRLVKQGDIAGAERIPKGTLGVTGAGVKQGPGNELSLIDFGGNDEEEQQQNAAESSSSQAATPAKKGNALEDDLLGLSIGGDAPFGQGGGISLGTSSNGMMGMTTPPQQSASQSFSQPPKQPKPNYDLFSTVNAAPPPKPATPQPKPALAPAAAPPASDPFAALSVGNSRTASPFQFQQSTHPAPAQQSTTSASLLGSLGNTNAAPAPAAADDEWTFTSSLPQEQSHHILVTNSSIRTEFTASRPQGADDWIQIESSTSNNSDKPVGDFTFQLAVTKGFTLKLDPQSSRTLAPRQRNGITQTIRLQGAARGSGKGVKMRWKASYTLGGERKEESGEIASLGVS